MNKIKYYIVIVLFFVFSFSLYANENENIENSFYEWIVNFKKIAMEQHNIDKKLLDDSFYDIKYNHKTLKLDRTQPEFTKTFKQYYENGVNNKKVKDGLTILNKYQKILQKIEKKYGIPKEIIVAFWGLESNYGKNKGKTIIIDSLTSLAFDHRRGKFFTNELIYSFKILQKNKLNKTDFLGSWAGAFGHFQFMPSTYYNYAIDGNKDNKIDIINNTDDALYSAGNFLSKLGWNKKYIWGRQVKFNKNKKKILKYVNENKWRDLSFFIKLGVKTINNKNIILSPIQAKLIAPNGIDGPYFLIYKNFNVIKLWNNSTNYALTVGLLADSIRQKKMIEIK